MYYQEPPYEIENNILEFHHKFDKNIYNIVSPDDLHTINFGNYFNSKISNVTFPKNLHTMYLGTRFKWYSY